MSFRFLLIAKWLPTTVAALVGGFVLVSCGGQVPLTAPAGATLQISANPTAIPVVDGVSTITVLGFKAADDGGGTLPDGTQIFFTTNVGIIEERVEMQNGVARGFLRSNGRAGLATVTASSGDGVTASLDTPVLIGNAEGINIVVTANPPSVQPPDFTSLIVATVFDNDNNALRDVPLIFSSTAGAMASQGTILRTNALGQATDRLTLLNESSATVTVASGTITGTVTVNRGAQPGPVVTSVFPSSGAPGETLSVTITGLNFQPGATVSFGQGIRINSVTFVNSNTLIVSITIDTGARVETQGRTVTVINPDGSSGSLTDAFRIVAPGALPAPIILSISPTSTTDRNPTSTPVTINGQFFQPGAQVGFSPAGIAVTVNSVTSTQIQITISIDPDPPGPPAGTVFSVTVINPDGGTDTLANAFTAN
ncbi:MAG: IPT/TIG domain-containing protein [Acidobacteriota bacterium]